MQKYKQKSPKKARRRHGGLQHVGIERRTLKEGPWRELSAPAKIFYLHLKGRHNGKNNGTIELPYSAMQGVAGCATKATCVKAVQELVATGWVEVKKKHGGHTRWDNLYRLTWKHEAYGCGE